MSDTQMVVCRECGTMALPRFMISMIDEEEKPCFLCPECRGTADRMGDILGRDEAAIRNAANEKR